MNKRDLPEVRSYGRYSSENYGVNTLMVDLGSIRLYYSYKTIVAFWTADTGLVTSKNVWTVTTGKHINWIQPDKSKRIFNDDFQGQLEQAISSHIV